MKPGNLLIQGAKSGGKREMRIRPTHIESSMCGFLYTGKDCVIPASLPQKMKGKNYTYGKKTVYI